MQDPAVQGGNGEPVPALAYSSLCGVVPSSSEDVQRFRSGRTIVRKRKVAAGDLVIVFENFSSMSYVTMKPGTITSNRRGHFHHDDIIGVEYGSMVIARKGSGDGSRSQRRSKATAGWVVILQPSPDLWTLSLKHRTQILYEADIAMILLHLEIRSGAVVVESGTGSCSLSTSLARAIAPTGRLFTYEFNAERFEQAVRDLKTMGLDHLVTCTHRNVVQDGFRIDSTEVAADAVFLDLPCPWDAIVHADAVLVPYGKICCFSPCIEQVQRTCATLRERSYVEIVTIECLRRTFDTVLVDFPVAGFASAGDGAEPSPATPHVGRKRQRTDTSVIVSKPFPSTRGHTGYLTFARKPLGRQ
ncbi:hypothetical protein PBRA_000037 [Plasmodiophora brassicae]|nr:hypothetical protein PBRA_000037 [Plasmodiophora brassicae]